MLMPEKLPSRLRLRLLRPFSHPLPPPPSQRPCRRCLLSTAGPARWPQKIPLGEYYESILRTAQRTQRARDAPRPLVVDVPLSDPRAADEKTRTPLDTTSSFDTSPPAPPPTSTTTTGTAAATATATEAAMPTTTTTTTTAEEKARIVFGSRLLGPAEQEDRAAAKRAQSTLVAGVLVPPRPEEPDNCCMSGCVNCVWDRYGEDLEEWTARKTEAEAEEEMLRATSVGDAGKRQKEEEEEEEEEDEKKQRVTKEMLEEEAYSDVPMAIREFIKLEKRLRDKHKQEGAAGG